MSEDNVKPIPSHHIDSYSDVAEEFKTDLFNLCVEHINDEFPEDWVIGIMYSVILEIQFGE